jgi:hypothetical protein
MMILRIGKARRLRSFFSSNYDPLDPEHEAIGRVHWVQSIIYVNILLYTRGLGPSSRTK